MFEFVEQGIKNNIQIFGFSDHAPMNFDKKYRMKFSEIELYLNKIEHLKTKFKNKIEILSGFEVDFLEGEISQNILNAPVDYLIGSIHFLQKWGFDNPEFITNYQNKNIDFLWLDYFNEIEKMANTKLFQIVGHLDLLKVFKFLPKKSITQIAEKSLVAIKKSNMAIEINSSGFRKPINEQYPSENLLKLIYDLQIPITFGSDAHSPEQVGIYHDKIEKLAKKIGFTKVAIFKNKKMELYNL
jgi:histidinol-phosphatase (PHP family)